MAFILSRLFPSLNLSFSIPSLPQLFSTFLHGFFLIFRTFYFGLAILHSELRAANKNIQKITSIKKDMATIREKKAEVSLQRSNLLEEIRIAEEEIENLLKVQRDNKGESHLHTVIYGQEGRKYQMLNSLSDDELEEAGEKIVQMGKIRFS
ncbi:hypothetical protein DID80_04625 [Candidatus Marinamargulisbacteria bacterium SCGC AAA071-K20]|nr:hypothetical protein DID80_04625 [Candidatus Marinamargulisbacteria bacterium SCGC AAA071-K20]